jgi:hypothetical protein
LSFEALDLDSVDEVVVLDGFNEASGDASKHGGIEVGVCSKGRGNGVGGERYNWGQKGMAWGHRGTACWQFIGDINGYVGHGVLVMKGAVVVVAEAGVLVTMRVGDIVLKVEEEVSEGVLQA